MLQISALKKLWANKRTLAFQGLNLGMVVCSALIIWTSLKVLTCSPLPTLLEVLSPLAPVHVPSLLAHLVSLSLSLSTTHDSRSSQYMILIYAPLSLIICHCNHFATHVRVACSALSGYLEQTCLDVVSIPSTTTAISISFHSFRK